MRKGLNMKMAAMGLVLVSMVACTGKTTTDATCCAANGEGNCPEGTCRKECTNACNTNNQKNKTMMKKVFLFVCTVFTLSSCAIVNAPVNGAIYQKTQSAVSATANTLGSKKGEATATSILGLVAYGDASIQKAAKEAGITKISHVDQKSKSVLGLFSKYTVIVYGD